VRNVRQELQKKTENESLESGKRKLELEGAKVELRRKTEENIKMK
jgi:ribosomal protein L9